jgi:hypothetical protein
MSLHTDIPTRAQVERLLESRRPIFVLPSPCWRTCRARPHDAPARAGRPDARGRVPAVRPVGHIDRTGRRPNRLADLRERGILTDEEFERAKAKVLA